jgi:hypothetical protein
MRPCVQAYFKKHCQSLAATFRESLEGWAVTRVVLALWKYRFMLQGWIPVVIIICFVTGTVRICADCWVGNRHGPTEELLVVLGFSARWAFRAQGQTALNAGSVEDMLAV